MRLFPRNVRALFFFRLFVCLLLTAKSSSSFQGGPKWPPQCERSIVVEGNIVVIYDEFLLSASLCLFLWRSNLAAPPLMNGHDDDIINRNRYPEQTLLASNGQREKERGTWPSPKLSALTRFGRTPNYVRSGGRSGECFCPDERPTHPRFATMNRHRDQTQTDSLLWTITQRLLPTPSGQPRR